MTGLGPTPFGPVLIVGTGMMGCSMARMIRQEYPDASVFGLDRDLAVAEAAAAAGHVTTGYGLDRLERLLTEAGLVVLATPVTEILDLLPILDNRCRLGALIVDLGSTKAEICRVAAMQPRIRRGEVGFVGGHPMAGSLRSGVEAASVSRLRGAPFLYCPVGGLLPEQLAQLEKFLVALGFEPIRVQPVEHDQLVAAVSHAPHLMAAALMKVVGNRARRELAQTPLHLRAAGRGLAAMTAKAAASPALWAGIIKSNARAVSQTLRDLSAELLRLADTIDREGALIEADSEEAISSVGDLDLELTRELAAGELERYLDEARADRGRLESHGFGIAPDGPGPAE